VASHVAGRTDSSAMFHTSDGENLAWLDLLRARSALVPPAGRTRLIDNRPPWSL